jgi:predicted TIM-barrel fold metal-dependent hydrolase
MNKILLISSDNHACPRPGDYADLLEEKYRDHVPSLLEQTRLFRSLDWPVSHDADVRSVVDPDDLAAHFKEGLWDPAARIAALDREGIAAEILFPGDPASIGMYFSNMNEPETAEYRAAGVRAHNRWLADFCSYAPKRILGVAQTEPWPDLAACVQQINEAKRNGMVAVNIPRFPGIEANQPPLTDPAWNPIWAALSDNDLTVSIHIGHMHPQGGMLQAMAGLRTNETGFPDHSRTGNIFFDPGRRPFWQMVMAGVFDRYPDLRVTFSELRTEWVAPTLAHLESKFDEWRFSDSAAKMPKLRPTDYWRRNCAVSHMLKPYDLALRYQIGVENLMFSSDYPHVEGTWPNTREWLRLALKGVPEDEARLIVGGNAARFYHIDVAALHPVVDRIGYNRDELFSDRPVAREFLDSFNFRSSFCSRPINYDASEVEPLLKEDQAAVLALANAD